jgi:tetratricopeptide (TPR) repeat protein
LTDVDESATVDCKSGPLTGCGLRFCSIKCRDACSQRGHADVCQEVQRLLAMLKAKHFRPDAETYKAAAELGNAKRDGGRNQAQICMLAADLFIAEDEKGKALQVTSDALLELGALRFALVSAEAALELAEEGTAEAANCYLKIGTILSKLGKHDAALLNLNKALPICQTLQVRAVVNCYINMANVLFAQGKHMAAMEKYMDVLRMFESKEREDVAMCVKIVLCDLDNREVADVATCVNNMGAVLRALGDYDGAMKMYEVVQQIHRCLHKGEEHADVADCYNNMGNVLQEQGEYEAAMERIDSALEIRKKLQGKEHADVAMCYINMGIVLHALDEHQKAMKKFEAALQIYKKVSGADSANYSSALLTLATGACVTKSSHDDTHLFAELRRIVDVDAELFNSIAPSEFAFGLRDHIVLLRLMARFGQRTGEATALEQWRTNVQRLINVSHSVAHAFGLQELAYMRADGRFASATACESERLLAALRASASPCALREATGAREQLLSSLFIDEGAHTAQMRAVAAHSLSLSLLGLDGLERVDDDLVAQLMRARVLEQEVLQRCAGELSNVKARGTSAEVRNSVADVFVLLLNVLDQAFARLAKASGATTDELYFPCKGSGDALAKAAGFKELAADIQQRIEAQAQQPFSFFTDASPNFCENEWLHLTALIANDNKHIKLSPHVHSATLKDKSRGTIEQRDVTLNVSASGPSPDLTNWTLYHWPALVEAARDDAERRAVSRLARTFLTGLEHDGNTALVGGVDKNKYLEYHKAKNYDLFFVPPPIAAMDNEALRRELVKDLARFDLVRKFSGKIDWLLAPERGDDFLISLCKRELEKAVGKEAAAVVDLAFVGEVKLALDGRKQRAAAPDTMPELFLSRFVSEIRSFLRMRIDWQTPSEPLAEASNEAQIDLVSLMQRAIDNTCKLVVEMVDKRVALGRAAIRSGADMFAPVDWLALSDAEARDVARGVDEVRASAWGAVDDLVKKLLADSDLKASASAYKSLHAIGRALENDDNVDAFAKLWERVIDRVTASESELARSLASVFAMRLRDTLLLRATTSELSQLLVKIDEVIGSFKIELPSLAGVEVDDDLLSQLMACKSSVHKLRVQSLQLRFGDGRDVLLRNEMSVALSVALGKCRAVLDHAFTRFARQQVWARMAPPPEAHKVFQAKFPVGHDSDSWRANVLQQLGCVNDGRRLNEMFPAVDDSVWAALESVQGYNKLGGVAWVDELASVVNESKHVRARLVDDALLSEWWARGDVKSVDASFPLFVRDEWFYPWSFSRECGGDAVASSALFERLCDINVLSARAVDGVKPEAVKKAANSLRVPVFVAPAFDGDELAKLMCNVGRRALSVDVLSTAHVWWIRADKFSRDKRTDLIRLGAFAAGSKLTGKKSESAELEQLREWIRGHAKLLAAALTKASLLSLPQIERALTPDEIAAAKVAFPSVDIEAVAMRVANCARREFDVDQEVDASVCVGGIEFLERCVQGAARAVAAMASASAKSAQPSGRIDADDDDGDVDDGGFGKQKLYPDRK